MTINSTPAVYWLGLYLVNSKCCLALGSLQTATMLLQALAWLVLAVGSMAEYDLTCVASSSLL